MYPSGGLWSCKRATGHHDGDDDDNVNDDDDDDDDGEGGFLQTQFKTGSGEKGAGGPKGWLWRWGRKAR